MPKSPTSLPSEIRPTDILAATQFAAIFPISTVRQVLEEQDRASIRVRDLPNECIVYFVMMLALFRNCNHREVFRIITAAFGQLWNRRKVSIPSPSALSQARTRTGSEPLRTLFNRCAKPVSQSSTPGGFYKAWRTVAIDGCLFDLDDTVENRQFFRSASNQHKGKSAWPQCRFVGLMETGTHLFFQGAAGGYLDSENELARGLIPRLEKNMLILVDRNFFSFEFFDSVTKTGAALVCRIQRGMTFRSEQEFDDHSHIVTIHASADVHKENGIKARLVQYTVPGSKSGETVFLLTNILDPHLAPAFELAQLYHERWEYESALDELKTHLSESAVTLRSKKPDLVLQELWGTLMTHYVVRRTMFEAAGSANLDPDRMPFTHTVRVLQRTLVKATSDFSP